jgi:hypothetical protein
MSYLYKIESEPDRAIATFDKGLEFNENNYLLYYGRMYAYYIKKRL